MPIVARRSEFVSFSCGFMPKQKLSNCCFYAPRADVFNFSASSSCSQGKALFLELNTVVIHIILY